MSISKNVSTCSPNTTPQGRTGTPSDSPNCALWHYACLLVSNPGHLHSVPIGSEETGVDGKQASKQARRPEGNQLLSTYESHGETTPTIAHPRTPPAVLFRCLDKYIHLAIDLVLTGDPTESHVCDVLQLNVLHTGRLVFQLVRIY
ncbi:hypothetical protein T265_05997 [Opisthorchis viverrini]|uniref:Uncharacterized protein n=1 Tax=Opisthorchis viverrini TaxID=6198 RepID=A0A074ZIN8_OPIVI|nr:hypothetical protein T265_05997 [Opisthorchis viverrini]KER26866.1 hypothetical protein T265_05997 [Opisthorchis viverrini]